MRPTTIIPSKTPASTPFAPPPVAPETNLPAVVSPTTSSVVPSSFPVALTPQEITTVESNLANADIMTINLRDIATLGSGAEQSLQGLLDQFLARIDRFDNPALFALFKKLGDQIKESDLPAVADRILNGKPTLGEKVMMVFSSAKARDAAATKLWQETQDLLRGKTRTLVDFVNALEHQLQTEQRHLDDEITSLESLKNGYRDSFRDFAVTTAVVQAFLAKARAQVEQFKQSANVNDPTQKATIDELEDKLQALESRALALEGTLTRLPADQLVIRQIQNAGISTLQETVTTAGERFASIKMTLLTLNGTMMVRNVQRVADQGRALDENLRAVHARLVNEVVTTAANAPGDNRLAQAQQIQQIVTQTQELQGIVEAARQTNAQKFDDARKMFDVARKDMLALGQQLRPGSPIR